jgi:hypothetical protein
MKSERGSGSGQQSVLGFGLRRVLGLALASAALLFAAPACKPREVLSAADPDARRDKAEPLALGGSYKDTLSFKESDAADWKAIEVPEAGRLRVVVYFGNPACFCQVELYDPAGKRVAAHSDIGTQPRADLVVEKAAGGRYLLKFSAKYEGDFSAYLVEPLFYAAPKPKAAPVDDDPGGDEEPPDEPPITAAAPEPSALEVKILKIAPGRTGYQLLTLDKGSADGVTLGAQGLIEGLDDGEFRVTKVEEKSSQAETAVSAKTLKGRTRGAIKLKRQ